MRSDQAEGNDKYQRLPSRVVVVTFARDRGELVAIAEDGAVYRSQGSGPLIRGPRPSARCPLAVAPNGKLVALAPEDGSIHAWNLYTAERIQSMERSRGPLSAMAFTADSAYLLSITMADTAVHFDLAPAPDPPRDPDVSTVSTLKKEPPKVGIGEIASDIGTRNGVKGEAVVKKGRIRKYARRVFTKLTASSWYGKAYRSMPTVLAFYGVLAIFAGAYGVSLLAGLTVRAAVVVAILIITPLLIGLIGDRVTGLEAGGSRIDALPINGAAESWSTRSSSAYCG